MKDFNDFLRFLGPNTSKVAYDASKVNAEDMSPAMNVLSRDVAEISYATTIALLRQYHEWLNSQQQQT